MCLAMVPWTQQAWADAGKPSVGIAAQVGDEVISSVDLENRIKFVVATAHLSNTPDVISHIRPQILHALIDERLQTQEAKKNDIKVSDKDINEAIEAIEQQRGMAAGDIDRMLEADHVPKDTFIQQIKAQLSWNRVLMRKVRSQVHVSDSETQMVLARLPDVAESRAEQAPAAAEEYKIAVVTLPVDKPSREKEIKQLAEQLVKEVREGANFEEVSRQFSSSSANAGGKVETFWVGLAQMEPRLAEALKGTKSGSVTNPIRSEEGFTIVKVYDTRGVPGAAKAENKMMAAAEAAPLTPEDKEAARREQAYSMLFQKKMELEAQKYLRNLRRETFIEIR